MNYNDEHEVAAECNNSLLPKPSASQQHSICKCAESIDLPVCIPSHKG